MMHTLDFFRDCLAAKYQDKQLIEELLQLWLEDVRQGEEDIAAGRIVEDADLDEFTGGEKSNG